MWKSVIFFFLIITFCFAKVSISDFFPFGPSNGDQQLPPIDDDSSPAQNLSITFPFFGIRTNKLYVNDNGAISFMNPITQFTPECKPVGANYSMIQPFW